MHLPWRKPKKNGNIRSQQAVLDATQSLERVQSRESEVRAVSKALKDIRERNHFAEQLQILMGGR